MIFEWVHDYSVSKFVSLNFDKLHINNVWLRAWAVLVENLVLNETDIYI